MSFVYVILLSNVISDIMMCTDLKFAIEKWHTGQIDIGQDDTYNNIQNVYSTPYNL